MSTRGQASPLYASRAGGGTPAPAFTVRPMIPSSDDDAGAGFVNGSQLYSTAAQSAYLCVDAAAGLWVRLDRHDRRNLWHMSPQVANLQYWEPPIFSTDGALATPAQTPGGTLRSAFYRTNFETAGIQTGVRTANNFFRPSVAGQGGMRLCEFLVAPNTDAVTSGLWFGGFSEINIAIGENPNTLANVFAFGKRGDGPFGPADTEIHLVTSDGAGTPTWTALGADFPANDAAAVYLASLYWSDADDGHAYAQLERLDAAGLFIADVTVNLPELDTLLLWICTSHDLIGPAPVSFDLVYMELETL